MKHKPISKLDIHNAVHLLSVIKKRPEFHSFNMVMDILLDRNLHASDLYHIPLDKRYGHCDYILSGLDNDFRIALCGQ